MWLELNSSPLVVVTAGVCFLCVQKNNLALASSSQHVAVVDRIPGRGGWYYRDPSFTSTKTTWSESNILLQTRGGSSEKGGGFSHKTIEADDGEGEALDPDDTSSDNATEANAPLPRNLTFSATKSYDGSLEDHDGIPSRFLQMKKGDREVAKESFAATLAWREEYEVDTLLSRAHHLYDVCKAVVPHYFSGRDPRGNIVFVQSPALLDFEMMRKNNATIDDLLMHYIFVIEYCWNILEKGPPEGVMTSVLDMRGLSLRNMKNQEYIGFGKRFVSMMSSHYPGRSYKTLVINAPTWFHALYKVFKPMLREATRDKIEISRAGKKQDDALRSVMGDSLPMNLLSENAQEIHATGTRYFLPVEHREDSSPGPNSLTEFDMRQLVIEQLGLYNETLQEVFC